MSNRTVRIAELVQRELGLYLHTKYQTETVTITVSAVEVAPDLKTGRIFVTVLGDEAHVEGRMKWLRQKSGELRRELAHRVKIKHSPAWVYVLDHSPERSNRVLNLLDEIEAQEKSRPQEE